MLTPKLDRSSSLAEGVLDKIGSVVPWSYHHQKLSNGAVVQYIFLQRSYGVLDKRPSSHNVEPTAKFKAACISHHNPTSAKTAVHLHFVWTCGIPISRQPRLTTNNRDKRGYQRHGGIAVGGRVPISVEVS